MNYFNQRTSPLKVEVYKGSIATKHDCLLNTDALVAIELIEHLTSDVLKDMPDVIFNYMKPKVAIFTTPNSEANVLFPDLEGFRHWDHKFEWTRQECEKWANDICERYPDYSVQFYQIGIGPPETTQMNFGGVSQCAVFLCKEFVNYVKEYKVTEENSSVPISIVYETPSTSTGAMLDEVSEEVIIPTLTKQEEHEEIPENDESEPEYDIEHLEIASAAGSDLSGYLSDEEYTLIFEVDYPFKRDDRTEVEKILDDSKYQISRMSRIETYIDEDQNLARIPLQTVFDFIFPVTKSLDQLRHVLSQAGYKITENDMIEVSTEEDVGLESSDSEDDHMYEENDEGCNKSQDPPTEQVYEEEECWD